MSLKLLICGLEHTGTTLLSDLFRQVPGLDSGFECGVLLGDSPADFLDMSPFSNNMLKGWGISHAQLEACCAEPDFDGFYTQLMKVSSVLSPGTSAIFDKTPRYLSDLTSVLGRSKCPVVVSYKDPRAIVFSDFKRAKISDFDSWYDRYRTPKLRYVRTCYNEFIRHVDNPRVTTIGLEDLAMNSRATMERMFAHVGETFRLSYAIIDTLRYANVKNKVVSADIAFEYVGRLPQAAQDRIMTDFGHFTAWIYD